MTPISPSSRIPSAQARGNTTPRVTCGRGPNTIAPAFITSLAHASPRKDARDGAGSPVLGRGENGIPDRVDRMHAIGNAVVPQIPELIGHAILASEAA